MASAGCTWIDLISNEFSESSINVQFSAKSFLQGLIVILGQMYLSVTRYTSSSFCDSFTPPRLVSPKACQCRHYLHVKRMLSTTTIIYLITITYGEWALQSLSQVSHQLAVFGIAIPQNDTTCIALHNTRRNVSQLQHFYQAFVVFLWLL